MLIVQGGFYDFTSDLTMKDMAYTSLALGAHTDTTYFSDPAGLQMFHLLSHIEGTGGVSLLVDGFNAAHRLRQESPESWDILASVPILWHASGNEGITITPSHRFPVLNVNNAAKSNQGIVSLFQIRWNNDDRGLVPVFEDGLDTAAKWYEAARNFDEILKNDDMQYWAQLQPGRPLIFDNWRVLHGRSAFSGKRRMCGGYSKSISSPPLERTSELNYSVNHDDFISRWRNTNFSRQEALNQIL
jgi:trimethyllysine dioxygenase